MSISKLSLLALSALIPSFVFAADAAAPAAQPGGGFGPVVFLVAILAFMYLLVWRPQQKKAKAHRALVSAVGIDDEVLLSSGIVGKVSATYEQYVAVNLGDNVNVVVQRGAVAAVLPKGTLGSLKTSK
jgi:preprotein translocase subunit YajC